MLKRSIFLAAALSLGGCGSFDWARLAPPGIVKYEDIAGEKPMNPAVEKEIAARTENQETDFPVLSDTPAARQKAKKTPKDEIAAERDALETAASGLEAAVEADRAAVAADGNADLLLEERDALTDDIGKDAAAARRDRKEVEAITE